MTDRIMQILRYCLRGERRAWSMERAIKNHDERKQNQMENVTTLHSVVNENEKLRHENVVLRRALQNVQSVGEGTYKGQERAFTALSQILFTTRKALWINRETNDED
jgi:regulator of replication initiation timing